MSTVEHIQDGLVRALDSVAEGWHEVRDLAGDALTRFRPKSTRGEVESADDRLVNRAARWGLLAAEVADHDRVGYLITQISTGTNSTDYR